MKNEFDIPKRKKGDTGPVTLTFTFDNEAMANHFKVWLCESGEQSYWGWMEYREQEEPTEVITVSNFDYHKGAVIPTTAKPASETAEEP